MVSRWSIEWLVPANNSFLQRIRDPRDLILSILERRKVLKSREGGAKFRALQWWRGERIGGSGKVAIRGHFSLFFHSKYSFHEFVFAISEKVFNGDPKFAKG